MDGTRSTVSEVNGVYEVNGVKVNGVRYLHFTWAFCPGIFFATDQSWNGMNRRCAKEKR